MMNDSIFLHCAKEPFVLDDTEDFAVVYKPPNMHCARQGKAGPALLDWYAGIYPPVLSFQGRQRDEGGLMHRLDFQTQGMVLFAKTQRAFEHFLALQDKGGITKEYSALCVKSNLPLPGFPPPPGISSFPALIESYFRPFGPGRKSVRPVLEQKSREVAKDKGTFYRTEIESVREAPRDEGHGAYYNFSVKITRGFRHQIRCHLAWIGHPIVNDALYGASHDSMPEKDREKSLLALCASGLSFSDLSGKRREYRGYSQSGISAINRGFY
jgi:23S rRNA pseudouridine1911/1915/1917 synthase